MPRLRSDALPRVLDVLDRSRSADDGSLLFHLVGTDDGFDLGLRPVDTHPADLLLGQVAADEWDALGVMASGWASPIGEGRASLHARRRATETIVIVHRDGTGVGRMRVEGQPVVETPPGGGVILESLQRAMGLATAPPDQPVETLATLRWMRAIAAAPGRRALSWERARSLQPTEVDGTWEAARRSVAEGRVAEPGTPPWLAAWMDDGMFCRWVAPAGALTTALAAARSRLTPAAVARLEQALGAGG